MYIKYLKQYKHISFITLCFIVLHRSCIFSQIEDKALHQHKDYGSLYCDSCFNSVTLNWTHNIYSRSACAQAHVSTVFITLHNAGPFTRDFCLHHLTWSSSQESCKENISFHYIGKVVLVTVIRIKDWLRFKLMFSGFKILLGFPTACWFLLPYSI